VKVANSVAAAYLSPCSVFAASRETFVWLRGLIDV
jgi:hypothetical protein